MNALEISDRIGDVLSADSISLECAQLALVWATLFVLKQKTSDEAAYDRAIRFVISQLNFARSDT